MHAGGTIQRLQSKMTGINQALCRDLIAVHNIPYRPFHVPAFCFIASHFLMSVHSAALGGKTFKFVKAHEQKFWIQQKPFLR